MRYPSPTLDGFDALWNSPTLWLQRQLAFYLTLAAIAAITFVAGAGIYSLLQPAAEIMRPEVLEGPAISPTPIPVPKVPSDKRDALVAHHGKELGAPIFLQGNLYGVVTEIRKNTEGTKRFVILQLTDGNKIQLPYGSVTWHSEEQGQWRSRYTVKEAWGAIENPDALPQGRKLNP